MMNGGEENSQQLEANLFQDYGGLVEDEAQRLHDIEMGMIRGKLELQTELLDRTMGQSKMRAGQIVKEGKILELQRQQADNDN